MANSSSSNEVENVRQVDSFTIEVPDRSDTSVSLTTKVRNELELPALKSENAEIIFPYYFESVR